MRRQRQEWINQQFKEREPPMSKDNHRKRLERNRRKRLEAKSNPGAIKLPNGKRLLPAVFLINTKADKGTPRLCTMAPTDQHEYHLQGGEEFMICYVPEAMFKED